MFLPFHFTFQFQFRPVVPSQQPPQFMPPAAQQFRPVGQPMPGANIGMPGQMPHFPQPGQHLSHSSQVPPASQGVPMAYQPARPMSSAPMQPQQQAAYPGDHLPTMGAPMQPPSYTVRNLSLFASYLFSFNVRVSVTWIGYC